MKISGKSRRSGSLKRIIGVTLTGLMLLTAWNYSGSIDTYGEEGDERESYPGTEAEISVHEDELDSEYVDDTESEELPEDTTDLILTPEEIEDIPDIEAEPASEEPEDIPGIKAEPASEESEENQDLEEIQDSEEIQDPEAEIDPEPMIEEEIAPAGCIDATDPIVTSLLELGMENLDVGAVPASYRSPYVTAAKSQGNYGTCWGFATIAASEASICREGLASTSLDLSEWQLIYYATHKSEDPMGLTKGDSVTSADYLNGGGDIYAAMSSLANWRGVVAETDAPYSRVSSNRNATLSQDLAYNHDLYHLENGYVISTKDRQQVKQAVMNYGAVATSFYYDSSYWNRSTNAYYCPYSNKHNHAITIIGWDDNYSVSNYGSARPSSNGAWLIKNSWAYGREYFWLAYEDRGIRENVYAFDYAKADQYDYNYQYDGSITGSSSGYSGHNTVYSANIFTSTGAQTLKAVGYYTYDTMYQTRVMVYKNLTDANNPSSGNLVASKTVTDAYTGYHTVSLDQNININRGDRFAIVIAQTAPNGQDAKFCLESSLSRGDWTYTAHADAGQSFASRNGSQWYDVGANWSKNVRIKAFTISREKKVRAFATRLYNKCLGRTPDASGLQHWTDVLLNGQRSGADVAKGFVFSKEYTLRNTTDEEYVEMLYNVFMDRSSDPSGKAHWLNYLSQGLSREYVFRGFAQSAEYTAICNSYGIERGTVTLSQPRDQNPNLTMYVARLYTKALGRPYDVDGLNHWCREIQLKNRTPQQVAEAFINSKEFRNKRLSNQEYIKVLYRTFMGREYDQAGLDHWLSEMRKGCSRQNILSRFAGSKEFRNIQASFGL